ncbi:MAG: RNA polymerase sigma factor [Flavobacteriales bacterium]
MLNPEPLYSEIERVFVRNDEVAIAKFYQRNFMKTQSYVLKNSGTVEDAKDVYQEAFIVLWRKVTDGQRQIKDESKAAGFLYQVSKNKWLDQLGSSRVRLKTSLTDERVHTEAYEENEAFESRLDEMKYALQKLGTQCKELLSLFYYAKKSMDEIGKELNLSSASARNQKYRCMKQLRELVEKP